MYNKEFRSTGMIGNDGKLRIYNQSSLDYFSSKNKEQKVIIEIKVIGTMASRAIVGYYRNYVIPEFRKAIFEREQQYLSLEKTEEHITELTPMLNKETWCDEAKAWIHEVLKFEDLDNTTAVHCLTHLKQVASMEYGFEIKDDYI